MKIEELQKKGQEIQARAEAILSKAEEENREMSTEEMDSYEAVLNEMDAVKRQIDLAKRAEEASKGSIIFKAKGNGEVKDEAEKEMQWRDAFYKYLRVGFSGMKDSERSLLAFSENSNGIGVAIDPTGQERRMYDERMESRAANSVITNGAYFQPTTLAEQFQYTLRSIGNWMDAVTVINDPAGNDLVLPYYNDAGNDGALEAEGTDAIASSTDLDAAKVTLSNYWISSTGVKVGWSKIRDVNYPVEKFVVEPLMQRLARVLSSYATTGTGSSQPKGIAIAAVTGELASKATYPTFTDLMNLIGMVDGAYDMGPKCGFMFHRSTALGIGKTVKSTTYNTDPLWQPSFADGLPKTLLGYPYWLNNSMNLITTAPGNSVLFGDFSHFIIRMCGPVIVTRLEERYAEAGQVGFLMSQYMDSNVDMVGTTYAPIKKIKNIMT